MKVKSFPKDFLWGASTSAYQVEGNTHNDWSEWEKSNAARLASSAEAEYSHWLASWPELKSQMTDPDNYISSVGANNYELYKEDLELAKKLNLNSYRLSIEWSRVMPQPGVIDEVALQHYVSLVEYAHELGITPVVTLWHWTFPVFVSETGGWLNTVNHQYFFQFTEAVVAALGDHVTYWLTINEPLIYADMSYRLGKWPPQKSGIWNYFRVVYQMLRLHQKTYRVIKAVSPHSQVGLAHNIIFYEAAGNTLRNKFLKVISDLWQFGFLKLLVNQLDFIGVNYYFHNLIDGRPGMNKNAAVSDLGWELYPSGIYNILKSLQKFNKPIMITENGLADAKDIKRESFIRDTLVAIHQAIVEGVNVIGYLHWSLIDNFEWDKGFWPRFGLIEVDFRTQQRTIRKSALSYSKIAKDNSLNS